MRVFIKSKMKKRYAAKMKKRYAAKMKKRYAACASTIASIAFL